MMPSLSINFKLFFRLYLATNLEATSGESTAMTAGRVLGDVVTVAQGTAEISGGLGAIGGSGAACAGTGVGCVLVAPATAGGTAAIVHGGAVGLQGTKELAENGQVLFAKLTSGGSGNVELPGNLTKNARSTNDVNEIFDRLEKYHGIDPNDASARLHEIKENTGRGGADNVLFDMSGNVYNPDTREWIGSLTAGGGN